jgi:nucleoside-diphosphate-sugar epimerase
MKYILSGASGVLGFALIKKIFEAGNKVSLLARSEKSLVHILEEFGRESFDSLHFIDLCDYFLNTFDLSGDVFIHLAWAGVEKEARNNIEVQMKNVQYTLDAIKLAKRAGCHTFVGAGSQAEFADSNTPMGSQTPTIPNSAYGAAKLAAGQMGRLLAESMGIRFYWFRIFSLFGPFDREYSFIMVMLKKFLRDEELIMTSGEQIWDYLYSFDAASIVLNVLNSNTNECYFSLGSGVGIRLKEFVMTAKRLTKSKSKITIGLQNNNSSARHYLVADTKLLMSISAYSRAYTFERGIKEIIQLLPELNV